MGQDKQITSQDSINIFYNIDRVNTKKPFLVFLHGLGGDLTAWNKEREAFKKLGFSTVAIDLRGHGLSGRPLELESYAISLFVDDVYQVLASENIQRPIIIGHCFGGMIAMSFAAKYQKKLSALVLIDTSYKRPYLSEVLVKHKFLHQMFLQLATYAPIKHIEDHADFKKFVGTSDIDLRRLLSDLLHTSLKSYLLMNEEIIEFKGIDLLNKIQVPTLVIHGLKDTIFPPKIGKYISERIVYSVLDVIPEGNHIVVLNNPKELIDDIDIFIENILPK